MPIFLIVDNLPQPFFDDELKNAFEPFGRVVSARLVRDNYGEPLGFGFVELETDEPARVISNLNGRTIRGQHIVVSLLQPPPIGHA